MLPTIEIGSFRLNVYWLIYCLAIVAGGMLGFHRLTKGGVSSRHALIGVLLIIWAGVAGSVLFKSLVIALRDLALTGELAWQLDRGSAFLGALAGAIGAGWFWFRRHGVFLGRAFDLWIVPVPLGQAIGRVCCLAAACCHCKPTASWLGLYLPDHDGFWAMRYPTQLLGSAADLIIFFALLRLERAINHRQAGRSYWGFPGMLFVAYILLYSAKRFAIEFLRGDTTLRLAGAWTLTHVFYAMIFLVALALSLWRWVAGGRKTSSHVPGTCKVPGT